MRPLRVDAAAALRLPLDDVLDTLVVKQDRAEMFDLTPVWAPVEPPAKRAKTAEVRLSSTGDVSMTPKNEENAQGSSDEEDSDSSGSNSDVSSEDDTSDVSDLDKFEEAYSDFGALTAGVDPRTLERACSGHTVPGLDLPGGLETLHSLANVPKSWPLARLTIPLSASSKHLERLLEGYCMEVCVTNSSPELQLHFVKKFAKDLVVLFALHLAEKISSLFRHVLDHPSKVLYDPETEPLFLPLFWFYPIYREMLNAASRHRPSKSMELRRAASGLVKVICRTVDSRSGGKGQKSGRPRKKDGALVGFSDWFGSMSMMNILYVWFPASWGPSVVEAIQKRNETWLAKKPVIRDPHIFNRAEVTMGPLSRELTYKIQKWNIDADGFHPILVANARVDWLALKDDDITSKFPILLEGILKDVFSQRASSAWQGAQPQKLTVSMLLPGTSTAAEWRDLLQSRRQFWPAFTTRHASLAPLCAEALQRERRQMQAKHLWYNLDINWVELDKKLQVLAPTGLSRDEIWKHLFLTKQRQNPFVEGRYSGADYEEVARKWGQPSYTFWVTRVVPVLPVLTWQWIFVALILTTLLHRLQSMSPKLFMHVAGRPRTVPTVLRGTPPLMSVMNHTSAITLLPLAQTPFLDGKTGMTTTQWATNSIRGWAGHSVLFHFLVEFNIWVLRTFHLLFTVCFTLPLTLAAGRWFGCFLFCLFVFVVFVFVCFPVLQVSGDFLPFLRE